ncbi:hypothetical protein MJO28_008789 [Puccinia striiformis f. sp. tritici]|uniref:Secreted protein n=3 Tax=Puccinia striiformis TaxID=27350 RepID=A0A0L0VA39_9BASI
MLYLVILLFIQAITAHYIPHGESGRASSHPSRAVVGERLNHASMKARTLVIPRQKNPMSKEVLSICLWLLGHIRGISIELNEMKRSKDRKTNNAQN